LRKGKQVPRYRRKLLGKGLEGFIIERSWRGKPRKTAEERVGAKSSFPKQKEKPITRYHKKFLPSLKIIEDRRKSGERKEGEGDTGRLMLQTNSSSISND